MSALKLIKHEEVSSSGIATISFTSIPQIYTDLFIVASTRTNSGSIDPSAMYFNTDSGPNYFMANLYGDGTNRGASTNSSYLVEYNNWAIWWMQSNNFTANTFGNTRIYIHNYALTTQYKTVSVENVTENNGTTAYHQFGTGLWRSNSAINAFTITAYNTTFAQYSSMTLYGVTKGSSGGVTVS